MELLNELPADFKKAAGRIPNFHLTVSLSVRRETWPTNLNQLIMRELASLDNCIANFSYLCAKFK